MICGTAPFPGLSYRQEDVLPHDRERRVYCFSLSRFSGLDITRQQNTLGYVLCNWLCKQGGGSQRGSVTRAFGGKLCTILILRGRPDPKIVRNDCKWRFRGAKLLEHHLSS